MYGTMVYHGFAHHHLKKKKKIHLNPPKKKVKKMVDKPHLQSILGSQKKELKIKCGQFCPNIFVHFSFPFSLQFGEIVFWKERRENLWTPPKSLIFFTLN